MPEAHQSLATGQARPGSRSRPARVTSIWLSWSTTSDGAPPWSGPFIVPIAPTTAEAMSDRVEVMIRQVNVEALKPCSAPTTK